MKRKEADPGHDVDEPRGPDAGWREPVVNGHSNYGRGQIRRGGMVVPGGGGGGAELVFHGDSVSVQEGVKETPEGSLPPAPHTRREEAW